MWGQGCWVAQQSPSGLVVPLASDLSSARLTGTMLTLGGRAGPRGWSACVTNLVAQGDLGCPKVLWVSNYFRKKITEHLQQVYLLLGKIHGRADRTPFLCSSSTHCISCLTTGRKVSVGWVRVLGGTEAGEHPWQCWILLILTPSLSFFGVQSIDTRFPLAKVRTPIHFSVLLPPRTGVQEIKTTG